MNKSDVILISAVGAIFNKMGKQAFVAKYGKPVTAFEDGAKYLGTLRGSKLSNAQKYAALYKGFSTAFTQFKGTKIGDAPFNITENDIKILKGQPNYQGSNNFITEFIDKGYFSGSAQEVMPDEANDGDDQTSRADGEKTDCGCHGGTTYQMSTGQVLVGIATVAAFGYIIKRVFFK